MAKNATKSEMAQDILILANENKELKSEISRLKKSNTALKNSNANIKESLKFKEADYKRIREDYVVDTDSLKSELAELKADFSTMERKLNKRDNEMLAIRRLLGINLSPTIETKEALVKLLESKESLQKEKHEQYAQMNLVIEKQKAELAELKELNAMQTKLIEEKEARLKELLAFNPSGAVKEGREEYNLLETKYNNLINIYNDLVYEHNALKSKPIANNAGLKIRQLVGIYPDATTEKMIDRVKELVDAYDKAKKRGAEVFEILGIDKNSPDLIEKVKQLMVEKLNLQTTNETYKSYLVELQNILGLKNIGSIHTAIKNLQADLEAAREQEDKNASKLNTIKSILI